MATGTETVQAGLTPLDGFPSYYVYVPEQCVGKTRSPLILLLHGGGRSGQQELIKFHSLADKYGMIVLAGSAVSPGVWDVFTGWFDGRTRYTVSDSGVRVSAFPERDVRRLDSALIKVLRTHAIDPTRLALLGFSFGGGYSLLLGRSNLDVFSRIAALSALTPFDGFGPQQTKTQFFLSGGVGEQQMPKQTLRLARILRQRGHAVVTQIGLRGHVDYVEDEAFVWAWLQQSWADPAVTRRVSADTIAELPLTADAVRHVTEVWTRFLQRPDSIRVTGRMAHQIQVPLVIGTARTTVVMTDLRVMATVYPSVAALLDSVGISAAQFMAVRTAIVRTGIARMAGIRSETARDTSTEAKTPFAPVPSTSVLGRNLDFWESHPDVFADLEQSGLWTTQ